MGSSKYLVPPRRGGTRVTGGDTAPQQALLTAVRDPAGLLAGRSTVNLGKRVEILPLRFPLPLFNTVSANLMLVLT